MFVGGIFQPVVNVYKQSVTGKRIDKTKYDLSKQSVTGRRTDKTKDDLSNRWWVVGFQISNLHIKHSQIQYKSSHFIWFTLSMSLFLILQTVASGKTRRAGVHMHIPLLLILKSYFLINVKNYISRIWVWSAYDSSNKYVFFLGTHTLIISSRQVSLMLNHEGIYVHKLN